MIRNTTSRLAILSVALAGLALGGSPTHAASKLALDVYTAPPEAFGVTSTIVYGPTEAVIIDTQFTKSDATRVAERLATVAPGRKLKAIFITHPHPDHYFGSAVLHERFPQAPILMSATGIPDFEKSVGPKIQYWGGVLGAEIPKSVPTPQPAPDVLTVDGERLEIVSGLQGDVNEPVNSYVWIPSLQAVVAGDLAYAGTHVWVAESNDGTRAAWRKSLVAIAARHPRIVVAGHKASPTTPDGPDSLGFVRAYLDAFERAKAAAKAPAELVAAMKKAYPQAALDPILEIAANAAFPH